MGITINGIDTESQGLYVSNHDGQLNLPEMKEQFYITYGHEGYQLSRRNGNNYEINGFMIADDMDDFKAKTSFWYSLFSAPGLRYIEDGQGSSFNTFCKDGFQIDKVYVLDKVYARIKIKLTIV